MKLRVRGFEWRTGDAITPGDFLQYLQEISAREYGGQILTVTQQGDWWAGLLLTDREARAFCKKVRRGTTFTVLPEHLADNTTVVDFNFFLVNPTTGRGLYQHYQHSPTVNQFCLFSQERFAELRQRRLEAEVKTLGPDPKRKAVVAVEERFLKRLGYTLLEQPGSFEDKVRSMQRAEAIHFELATLEPVEGETTPLVGAALTVRTTIRFDPKHPARQIVKSIADLASRERFKNATVDGIDAAGQGPPTSSSTTWRSSRRPTTPCTRKRCGLIPRASFRPSAIRPRCGCWWRRRSGQRCVFS